MSTELDRYKAALDVATSVFRNRVTYNNDAGAEKALKLIDATLCPEGMVPLTHWAIVAPSGYIEHTVSGEAVAKGIVSDPNGKWYGYEVAKLTGAILRPKVNR